MKTINKTQRNLDIISILQGEAPQFGSTIDELVEYLTKENEKIARQSNNKKEKDATEIDAENSVVLNFLGTVSGANATEIANACNLANNQKATSISRRLVANGQVTFDKVKGRVIYRLA